MKTIFYRLTTLLVIFIFFMQSAHAQTTDSFYLRTQYIFQHLEKNKITTGMLQDYGIDFIDIENYDGTQLSDTNQISYLKWQDLYKSLYTYQINTNAPLIFSPDSVNHIIYTDEKSGFKPMSLLLIQYDKFRDDAATNNLVTVSNDQIYDRYVNGVWQDPYEIQHAFAIGIPQNVYQSGDITYKLPSNLVFNNVGTIQSIQADFDDGNGWRNIVLNQNVTVNYPDTGYKHIQFKVTLSNNQAFQSSAAIWVLSAGSPYSRKALLDDKEITIPATANYSGGTMEIHYSSANAATQQITKPLIIAEGFDPWKYQRPYTTKNNISFDDFWNNRPKYGPLESLIENDYDIIYLDYDDGTDEIQRNAALLEEVIQRVDSLKALSGSIEKNVVMGVSMGGLVARWALTDMENKSEDHDTRLFISYDAPMLGANVPLGFQALDTHLAHTKIKIGLFFGQIGYITTVGSLEKPLQIYETPAAQEMLHYYVASNPVNENLYMDNTVHHNFMNALHNLNTTTHGYPTQCRNVAVSNGAEASALDIGKGEVSLTEPDYLLRYEADNPPSPPKNTPFANFITVMNSDKVNEEHTLIEERMGSWVAAELSGTPETADCSAFCSGNLQISGSDNVCTSSVFSIPGLPASATVTWSASPSGIVNLTPNGNQVTVTKVGNDSVTLSASITSPCSSFPVMASKHLFAGLPTFDGIPTYSTDYGGPYLLMLTLPRGNPPIPNEICDGHGGQTNINILSASSISWSKTDQSPGASVTWYQDAYHNLKFWIYGEDEWAAFKISYGNACGSNEVTYKFKTVACDPYPPHGNIVTGELFTVSPNPAQNTITISLAGDNQPVKFKKLPDSNTAGKPANGISSVKLYNASGKTVKQQQVSGNRTSLQIDISDLAAGIYFVKITAGDHSETHKLVISR